MKRIEPLLEALREKESRNDYDAIVWLVDEHRYPPRNITKMTVQEVLDWQDSVDRFQNSEAVGAYQVMEDTLRGMVDEGLVDPNWVFNKKTQDHIGTLLLKRRGLMSYLNGAITRSRFANSLAKEWASFPVVTDTQGQKRFVKRGQSYYAGDGQNKAGIGASEVEAILEKIRAMPPTPYSWLHKIVIWLFEKFTKYRRT